MNYIDYIIVAVVVIFTVRGLFRGFFYEVLGFISLIVALILATKFTSNVAEFVDKLFDIPASVITLIGFLLIFIGVTLGLQILTHYLHKVVQYSFLSWLEKLAGATVGFLKGAIIMSLLLLLISILPFGSYIVPDQDKSVLFLRTRNVAPQVFNTLIEIVPNSKSFYDELKEAIDKFSSIKIGRHTQDFIDSLNDTSKQQNEPTDDQRR